MDRPSAAGWPPGPSAISGDALGQLLAQVDADYEDTSGIGRTLAGPGGSRGDRLRRVGQLG